MAAKKTFLKSSSIPTMSLEEWSQQPNYEQIWYHWDHINSTIIYLYMAEAFMETLSSRSPTEQKTFFLHFCRLKNMKFLILHFILDHEFTSFNFNPNYWHNLWMIYLEQGTFLWQRTFNVEQIRESRNPAFTACWF